jgi:sec-independent protein translocase protein TatC
MARQGTVGRRRLLRRGRRPTTEASMTMAEHLGELRSRLIVSLVAFAAISIVAFFYYKPMSSFLMQPLCSLPRSMLGPNGCRPIYTGVLGGINFRLKLTAIVGLGLTSPVWLYETWAFITPALTRREKRYALPFLSSSIALFLIGATFAYLTLPLGLRFLIGLAGQEVTPLIEANSYLNFVALVFIAFGLTFELPLVLIFLGLAGVVSVEQLRRERKVAFVAIFALAAVVTPSQDPYTMSAMAIPLYAFYEISILVISGMLKSRART